MKQVDHIQAVAKRLRIHALRTVHYSKARNTLKESV
jgi:hypothetical protein